MNREFFDNIYKKTEGFLMDEEARLLYALAVRTQNLEGAIVEIGSWKGKSTVVFGYACKEKGSGKVYAVDPHTGSPEHGKVWTFPVFEQNVKNAGVEAYVTPLVKTSEDAVRGWKEPVRLLWIDGNHDYEHASSDFQLWEPFVMEGGIVAFHDTIHAPGVTRVMKEMFFASGNFKDFGYAGNIVYARKTQTLSAGDKLCNCVSRLRWSSYACYTKTAGHWLSSLRS